MLHGDSLEGAILSTICYLDVFSCAPSARELHRFLLGRRVERSELEAALTGSEELGELIASREGFWFLRGKDHLVPRRIRFLEHSRRFWPTARRIASRVERSGIATAAFVTGSLAADNSDEHADIDFLLIYPAARAWTSWAMIRLAIKIPGLGLKGMCANYALPEDQLEIRPQNLFTAWEIAKAVPLFGFDVYERFVHANAWVARYLPNALPILRSSPPAPLVERDPAPLRALTQLRLFRELERTEKKRKFARDTADVGVDMENRARRGSLDRHTPTRSFQTLSELRYRMAGLGLTGHPLYAEVAASTSLLRDEMSRWGERPIPAAVGSPEPMTQPASVARTPRNGSANARSDDPDPSPRPRP